MRTLAHYLDDAKRKAKLSSDTELATLMGVSRQHISRIRAGDYMGEEKCFVLAEILGLYPLEIISLNWAIRAKDKKIKSFWLEVHAAERRKLKG